jgi:hypothetical protein
MFFAATNVLPSPASGCIAAGADEHLDAEDRDVRAETDRDLRRAASRRDGVDVRCRIESFPAPTRSIPRPPFEKIELRSIVSPLVGALVSRRRHRPCR